MGREKWKEVWNAKEINRNEDNILQSLIYSDGFDGSCNAISAQDWIEYVDLIESCYFSNDGLEKSIFEIGCGSGALLYRLHQKGYKVGGIDFSEGLVKLARKAIPDGSFACGDALTAPIADAYGHVVSNSVFQYFPDYAYAEKILDRMKSISKGSIAVLDVPNLALKEESENARRGSMPKGEYDKKYDGLEHLYYSKEWMMQQAERLGMKASIIEQRELFKSYVNKDFRFSVFMVKNPL